MLGVGVSCNVPGDGAGDAFEPSTPSCPLHQEDVARGKPAPRWLGEDAVRSCPCRSASTRELNVGSLEALGSFTRSRTEAPSPSLTRPSARSAVHCWSLSLAGDDSVDGNPAHICAGLA